MVFSCNKTMNIHPLFTFTDAFYFFKLIKILVYVEHGSNRSKFQLIKEMLDNYKYIELQIHASIEVLCIVYTTNASLKKYMHKFKYISNVKISSLILKSNKIRYTFLQERENYHMKQMYREFHCILETTTFVTYFKKYGYPVFSILKKTFTMKGRMSLYTNTID